MRSWIVGSALASLTVAALLAFGHVTEPRSANASEHSARPRIEPAVPAVDVCVARQLDTKLPVVAALRARLALGSFGLALSEGESASLRDALEVSVSRWEARANPLVGDFEDVDPDESLTAWMAGASPSVRLARHARSATACGVDGLCARIVPAGSPCPEGWTRPQEADRERARFFLWTWAHALRVSSKDAAVAATLAARVRARAKERGSLVGWVVFGGDSEALETPALNELEALYARRAALHDTKDELDTATTAVLDVAPTDIVILPKREAIQAAARFVDEVTQLTREGEPTSPSRLAASSSSP